MATRKRRCESPVASGGLAGAPTAKLGGDRKQGTEPGGVGGIASMRGAGRAVRIERLATTDRDPAGPLAHPAPTRPTQEDAKGAFEKSYVPLDFP